MVLACGLHFSSNQFYSVSCINISDRFYANGILLLYSTSSRIHYVHRHSKHIVGCLSAADWLRVHSCVCFIIIYMHICTSSAKLSRNCGYTQSGFIHSSGTLDAYDF